MTTATDWRSVELSDLTRHITGTHHAYLYRQLPLIATLLSAHVRRYWLKHPELLKAHKLFHQMQAEIEQHLIKEETIGFPLVEAHSADPSKSLKPFVNAIDHHLEEHSAIGVLLGQIRAALWGYQAPADTGNEVGYTCGLLEELEKDMAVHVHLENDILFPRIRELAG